MTPTKQEQPKATSDEAVFPNMIMTLIYLLSLCLYFKAGSCNLPEAPNVREFSINVTKHIQAEAGECITIRYELTSPPDKDTVPYKIIWFSGDPQNTDTEEDSSDLYFETEEMFDIHMIYGLPQGEYEYGLRLEWGRNQTYIFPERVRISVSASTQKPFVQAFPMTEGEYTRLSCDAPPLCFSNPLISWRWTKADGSMVFYEDEYHSWFSAYTFFLVPVADDHNTNITCVAKYNENIIIETTVTLNVQFPPKILNGSQCVVESQLLVCVCISRGNPLPPITWRLGSLLDYSITSSSSIQTVKSTITMLAAEYQNTNITCSSKNELGQFEIEIPLQNNTDNLKLTQMLDSKSDVVHLWIIIGVSLSLNLMFLITLIYSCRRAPRPQRNQGEEIHTYATLNLQDVEQYSVISAKTR